MHEAEACRLWKISRPAVGIYGKYSNHYDEQYVRETLSCIAWSKNGGVEALRYNFLIVKR